MKSIFCADNLTFKKSSCSPLSLQMVCHHILPNHYVLFSKCLLLVLDLHVQFNRRRVSKSEFLLAFTVSRHSPTFIGGLPVTRISPLNDIVIVSVNCMDLFYRTEFSALFKDFLKSHFIWSLVSDLSDPTKFPPA
jgi:hypothetical protein